MHLVGHNTGHEVKKKIGCKSSKRMWNRSLFLVRARLYSYLMGERKNQPESERRNKR